MDFYEEHKPDFNTLVLYSWKLVKLIRAFTDNHDNYFEYYDFEEKKTFSASAAIGHIRLKGVIEQNDYDTLLWQWNENLKRHFEEGQAQ